VAASGAGPIWFERGHITDPRSASQGKFPKKIKAKRAIQD